MMDCLPLVAACDVLCVRTFEVVGKRVVRSDRSRYKALAGRPFDQAHLIWQPDPETVEKALETSFGPLDGIVSRYGCLRWDTAQVQAVLSRYIRDRCHQQQPHDPSDLAYRMGVDL